MKKLITVILASSIILTACSDKNNDIPAENTSDSSLTTETTEVITEPYETTSETVTESEFGITDKFQDMTLRLDTDTWAESDDYINRKIKKGFTFSEEDKEFLQPKPNDVHYVLKHKDVLLNVTAKVHDDIDNKGFASRKLYENYIASLKEIMTAENEVQKYASAIRERNDMMYVETRILFTDNIKGIEYIIIRDNKEYLFSFSAVEDDIVEISEGKYIYDILDNLVFENSDL